MMIIIGEQEVKNNTLAVRVHGIGDKGVMSKEDYLKFYDKALKESKPE